MLYSKLHYQKGFNLNLFSYEIVFFNCLVVYHTSPDSGARHYRRRA